MKKIYVTFLVIFLTIGTTFASISNAAFKQLLKTGSPEQVKGALADSTEMDMKQSLCYALRYSTQPGIIKALADNGADIFETKCFSPIMGVSMNTLVFSTYYKNLVTTEDLLKLGVPPNNFSLTTVASNMDLTKIFIKYSNAQTIEMILNNARSNMNNTADVNYLKFREIAAYLQTIDVNLPELIGKTKTDIAMQFGIPNQKMEIDANTEMWTYYKHVDDTHYNGAIQGSSYDWGYGMSTTKGSVTGGYTATNSEKYTMIFQDGIVTKAKKNYDRQIH